MKKTAFDWKDGAAKEGKKPSEAWRVEAGKKGIATRIANGQTIGFGALAPEERKEIARLGGLTAHQLGVAHRFTPEEARLASRKRKNIKKAGDEN